MRMRILAGTMCVATAAFAAGQPPMGPPAKTFEVASVRKSPPPDMRKIVAVLREGRRPGAQSIEGSRATFSYESLKQLIAYGYRLRDYEVEGPDWLATDRMEISAKLPEGTTENDVPEMMRALLAERFKLQAHKETRDVPVLGLLPVKNGLKLTESKAPIEQLDLNADLRPGESRMDTVSGPVLVTRNPNGTTTYHLGARGVFTLTYDQEAHTMELSAKGMSMGGLAMMITTLGGGQGREVVDMTGTPGRYDATLEFSQADLMQSLKSMGIELPVRPGAAADGSASEPGDGGNLSASLSHLGLKLERSHAAVPRLIVDHVEADPTEQ